MPKIILKIIPALIFWGSFIFVIFNIPYPDSLVQASFNQAILFFISLFLAIIFTLNIFLKNILRSGSITLGLIFLLILKGLDALNIVTGLLVLTAVGLLFSYFKRGIRGLPAGRQGIRKIRGIRKNPKNQI